MSFRLAVIVQTPVHSAFGKPLVYASAKAYPAGTLVRVPFGKRELMGVVWDAPNAVLEISPATEVRPISYALEGIAPLNFNWCQLVRFTANYYQRALGEVAISVLPPALRDLSEAQLARKLKTSPKNAQENKKNTATEASAEPPQLPATAIALSPEQIHAIDQCQNHAGPFLLFGTTGSGKTEVYLQCVQNLLAQDPTAQALIMVPEINLTPQLEQRFQARFIPLFGAASVVALHSGMTPQQRLKSWLAAHLGSARIVLGTRMAVFASMPNLRLIVVDEEHDPSYKQQEGARYSARDLAVYRGHQENAKVILGSATPSFESWHHSRPAAEGGRYLRINMPSRIGAGNLPLVRRVNMGHQPRRTVFSAPLLNAISERIRRGEQSLVFLNRRGYAPVLDCHACGWKSTCPHCSAFRVFHKLDGSLRCHHCGFTQRVPRACPDCGNLDIKPVGRGTEQLEEQLQMLLAEVIRPDGEVARISRIDADTTKHKGALESQLAQVHSGEIDVLVGTQMIAKGHDFRRITLVAAVNPDNALFSSDFRAPERLFSLLMQAAGRAGRNAAQSEQSEMWVQTAHPDHALYNALKNHDFPAFAAQQLEERAQALMPPFSFQALVRAEARSQEVAQGFLNSAIQAACAEGLNQAGLVQLYPAVPMTIQRIANIERAQMVVESTSRGALQRFLADWQNQLHATRLLPDYKSLIRWAIDVDPLAI